jgi:hypothetical protein
MPRYFFNVIDGEFLVDDDGTDCANMKAARNQAITTADAILRDKGGRYPVGEEWQMYVTDEGQKTVLKLRFSVDEPA